MTVDYLCLIMEVLYYYFLGNWLLAEENENCHKACNREGLICKNKITHRQNGDVDSSDKLIKLIQKRYDIKTLLSKPCIETGDASAPLVTIKPSQHNWCMHTTVGKESEKEIGKKECSAKYDYPSHGTRRLCYCFYPQ